MPISPDQYEKLGTFYLGREYDLEAKQVKDDLILYDSKDLVTHGVVLGMTGSGKTGLCLALLEEAAMDGVPVIAIDPKGDIGNALLTFPHLSAQEFRPWINEDEARRKGQSPDDYAAAQSALWQKGLGEWGQSAERIQKLRATVDMAIYTPGSNAGLPVSILSSLNCPPAEVMDDGEALADRIESTVSSMLGLIGVDADPVQSPEHILLSNIVGFRWKKGQNITLENLVRQIQQPPIRKIGVVDLDSFLPESKRTALAMKLNNLLASPGFSTWLEGEPLDIQRMYYTPEGRPRITIFCIAHLSDTERMFFVSLLMNQLLGWMRTQQGTTSLRAIFYMDEIYGYLPPTAMPPSKKPLMILLKQARAFGLGILLATQNPADLDYKALANIGTWWLGRLQTERDKMRVLEGLEGAANTAGGKFDRQQMEQTLAGLGNRVFLMNNVHEDHPVVFTVRWLMSYLSGPLSRPQIKALMDPLRPKANAKAAAATAAEDDGFAPPGAAAASADRNTLRPKLPETATELFQSSDDDGERITYTPAILRSATIVFDDAKRKISGRSVVTLVNEIDIEKQKVLWDKFVDVPKDDDLSKYESEPKENAAYADLPGPALKSTTYTSIKKDFTDWVFANHSLEVFHSPLLEVYSNPGEKQDEFKARITQTTREQRDAAIEELRTKTAKAMKSLQDKAEKAAGKVDVQQAQASSAKLSTAVQIGGSILGAIFGRKTSVVKASTINSASRAWKEGADVKAAQNELDSLKADITELEKQIADDTQKIRDQYDPATLAFETFKLSPQKKNIQVTATGILWLAR
ncbi:helicase HerA domain-containing protein [Prosthecobacter sp.]|uniref:helicase HerA domain-containing protein n=1 Tax=Prosthecobacter sp. TaxID=1965333 RepID=UPI003784CD8D